MYCWLRIWLRTAKVKITFCNALREAGAEISDTLLIFYYDIFPKSREILAEANLRLHHLATWWDVLAVCKRKIILTATLWMSLKPF